MKRKIFALLMAAVLLLSGCADSTGSAGGVILGNRCSTCKTELTSCSRCGGTGACGECDSAGTHTCSLCGGEKKICPACSGGHPGSHHKPDPHPHPGYDDEACWYCGGLGFAKCVDCVTGSCIECGGDGEIPHYTGGELKYTDCAYCAGGRCRTCGGDAEASCPYC